MGEYRAAGDRYASMRYRRAGRSGLDLPEVSLGLWHNFGDTHPLETQRAVLRRAFDLGVTQLDLANNYGPPYGSAEESFGRLLAEDLAPYRDELVITTKAGFDMWPGPYGDGGSAKYLTASLDQSLTRMGLEYVDVFYSHRPDPSVPVAETMGALHRAVTHGKALYVGISNYSPAQTLEAHAELERLGLPMLVHQARYNMLDRWVEGPEEVGGATADAPDRESLLDVVGRLGVGVVAFSPLAQGLLTDRYLDGTIPADSRAAGGHFLTADRIDERYLALARSLNEIAAGRGQSLAQLAVSWLLSDERVTTVLVGASSVRQLEANVGALAAGPLTEEELAAIEEVLAG